MLYLQKNVLHPKQRGSRIIRSEITLTDSAGKNMTVARRSIDRTKII
jgi:hypothetical protein